MQATIHGVTKSQTRLSDFTFTFHFPALGKEMVIHSSVLAWRIPWTEDVVLWVAKSWTRLRDFYFLLFRRSLGHQHIIWGK